MINSLQSLRGVFAIMIFLSHFNITAAGDRAFYPGGTMGVEFFIMLSGFVMCAGYEKVVELKQIGYRDFMVRRLIRLYPVHLLCLTLWLAGHKFEAPLLNVATNLFMVQAWVPDVDVFYGCNTPSWCLGVFVFLYAIFPFLIHSYYQHKRLMSTVLMVAIPLFVVYIVLLPSPGRVMELWLSRILPPVRLIDFGIGMGLWQLYREWSKRRVVERLRTASVALKTCLEVFVIGMYAVASIMADQLTVKWCSELVWWIPTAAALMLFSLTDKSGGLLCRLLETKPLVAFGNASFCFYLLHMIVVNGVYRITNHFDVTQSVGVMLCGTLVMAIVATMLVSRYFDKPVGKYLRKMLA